VDLQSKRKRKEEVSVSIVAGIGHFVYSIFVCWSAVKQVPERFSDRALWSVDIGVYRLNLHSLADSVKWNCLSIVVLVI
jgi:hypothetical protein